jgi:ABC-type polysaccharide/polyol phosphate export permease
MSGAPAESACGLRRRRERRRGGMGAYLGAIWKCRYFWLSLVKIDLRARYRGSVFGIGWSLLHPIGMTLILGTVFRFDAGRIFSPSLFIGLTFWNYFSNIAIQGCQCFFRGEAYIRQHPAPMAIYPLRTMLASAFHFGVALLLALALTCFQRGTVPALAFASLVPTLLLVLVFGWSVAVLAGLLNVRFRDTAHLTEVSLSGLFFLTPVMYRPGMEIFKGRRFEVLLQYNPLTPFLELLRVPILNLEAPGLPLYLAAGLTTLVVAGVAIAALRFEERRLIFHL